MIFMKSCQEATRLISESKERSLTLNERMLLKTHVLMCAGCRNFEKQMHTLRQIAHAYAKGNSMREPYETD